MGKSSPKAPAAPDPLVTSAAQTQSNKETASWQAALNAVNQQTPWGSLTYSQVPGGGKTYDEDAYNKAMDAYNTQLETYRSAGSTPNSLYRGGYAPGKEPTAPDREKFLLSDTPQRWQLNMELSPEQQKLYEAQVGQDQKINDIAGGYMDRISGVMGRPFSLNGLPGLRTNVQSRPLQYGLDYSGSPKLPGVDDFSADANKVRDAYYAKQTSMLDPEYEKASNQQEAKLANQGIMPGSEAYKNAWDDYNRSKSFDYDNARTSAILAGGNEQSRLFGLGLSARQQDVGEKNTQGQFYNSAVGQGFGQDLQSAQFANQARQQALQEALTERQLPLNEFNALRSASQIQTPQFGQTPQTQMQPTNVLGAYQNQYQGQLNNYNSQLASNNNAMSGLFGLGGSLIGAAGNAGGFGALFSDRRLKRDIKRIGKTPAGINVYKFKYIGDVKEQIGVMAQEVERIIPEAVITFLNGFKAVDYGRIC